MKTDRIPAPLAKTVDVLVLAIGWWLIALSLATCFELVARKLFAFSLQGIDEIGGYTLAVTGAVGFSYALLTRGHTRIDFLLGRLPQRVRAPLNVLAMTTLAALALFATLRGWTVLAESIEFQSWSTTPLQTPMWIPQSLWLVGWALFAVTATWLAIDSVRLYAAGRLDVIDRAYGPQTLDEEIESEAGDVLADLQETVGPTARPRTAPPADGAAR